MGRRKKYIDVCCSSCGKETWAWWKEKYPLCIYCNYDSDKNKDARIPNRFKKKERVDCAIGYNGYWIPDTR